MQTQHMLAAHPAPVVDTDQLAKCINACLECAQVCMSCADACLAEDAVVSLRGCIHTDWNCADICATTARVLTRQTEINFTLLATQLDACSDVCEICARECERHRIDHEHCRVCGDTCYACARTCRALRDTM